MVLFLHLATEFLAYFLGCLSPSIRCNSSFIETSPDGPSVIPYATCDVAIDRNPVGVFNIQHHDVFTLRRSSTTTRASLGLDFGCVLLRASNALPFFLLPVLHQWIV